MDRLDVLLVLPPVYQTGRVPDYNPKEPMGLMYLAAALREKGYMVGILDGDVLALTIEETLDRMLKFLVPIIGFSVWQRALPSLKLLVEGLRKRGFEGHICCGGFAATLSVKHILKGIPGIDSIVVGEGEVVFARLVEEVLSNSNSWKKIQGVAYLNEKKEVVINGPSQKPDINSLPWPSRDLLPVCLEKTNYATVLGSRGCYGNCTFCSNASFERASLGPTWRGRNPEDIAEEIETLYREYKVRLIKFNDPNLFGPGKVGREHVVELCRAIIKRKLDGLHLMAFCRCNDLDLDVLQLMKRVGFERLLIGIESADAKILQRFQKGVSPETVRHAIKILRQAEMSIVPGFLIFNPYTTIQSLQKDIAFLEEYRFTPVLSKALRVFDGTPIQKLLEAEGRLIWRHPLEGYHEYRVDPIISSIYMSLKEFFVQWFDPFMKTYQDEWWKIKKAPSFKERQLFYKLGQIRFLMELEILKALIIFSQNGFSYGDVSAIVSQAKEKMVMMEYILLETVNRQGQPVFAQGFSEEKLSDRVYSILTNRPFSTFPEHYRWSND